VQKVTAYENPKFKISKSNQKIEYYMKSVKRFLNTEMLALWKV